MRHGEEIEEHLDKIYLDLLDSHETKKDYKKFLV